MNIQMKGSCVTREALNYWKVVFPDIEDIKVDYYMFQKPIAVLASNKIKVDEDIIKKIQTNLINSKAIRDFVVKQLDASFSKIVVKNQKKYDYYLMDFIDERMQLIKYKDSYIEYRDEIWKIINEEGIRVENTIDIFKEYIDKFINKIKEYYSEDRIVLHKAYAICNVKIYDEYYYLTDTFNISSQNYNLHTINGAVKRNNILSEIYRYIEDNYPNIKVIELPYYNYYSPIGHRYGRGYYHYDDQYYIDFVLKLKKINDNEYDANEVKKIRYENYDALNRLAQKSSFNNDCMKYINDIKSRVNNQIDLIQNKLFDFKYEKNDIIYRDDQGRIIMNISYERGLMKVQKIYNKGKITILNIFNEYGNISESRYLEDGQVYRTDFFDKYGYLIRSKYFENNKLIKDMSYYDYVKLGRAISVSEYNIDGTKKSFSMYYGDGKIRSKTYYTTNNIYEKTEIFESNGNLKELRLYYPNKIQKKSIQYNNGKERKIINYFSNGKPKEVISLDENSNIIKVMVRNNIRDELTEKIM